MCSLTESEATVRGQRALGKKEQKKKIGEATCGPARALLFWRILCLQFRDFWSDGACVIYGGTVDRSATEPQEFPK